MQDFVECWLEDSNSQKHAGLSALRLRCDFVCDHPTSIRLSLRDRDAQQKDRNIVENVGGTTGVELLCLDLSMMLADLQMQCKSVWVWARSRRQPHGGHRNSASTFCFHVVREAKSGHEAAGSNTPCSIMQDLGCRNQCLTACSVRICRSWIHCTFIERPCRHAHPSDSLSRRCRRFRPIVVFSCYLELAQWVCQYGPAHLTCI